MASVQARLLKGSKSKKSKSSSGEAQDREFEGGNTINLRAFANPRQDSKNDKYNDDLLDILPLRRSESSLILNYEHQTFLGGVRFTGEICLKERLCDPVDYTYREDSLLEAHDRNTGDDLGFCLTYPTYYGGSSNPNSNSNKYLSGLTMSVCDETSEEQEWRFLRIPKRDPLISIGQPLPDDLGLYMIYNPASDVVLSAAHERAFYDDIPYLDDIIDKYEDKNNDKYADEDDDLDIVVVALADAEMDDDKVLWLVNEDRFWNFEDNIKDIIDDDIFGSPLSISYTVTDVERAPGVTEFEAYDNETASPSLP